MHSQIALKNISCWNSTPSKHVQILSPGRSGTRWLANVLLDCSNSALICHASPRTLAEPGYLFNQGLISDSEALGAYRYSRSFYLKYTSVLKKCFFDLDCKNTPLAPVIAANYENCKFVILIRDPIDFIKSGINRGYFRSKDPQAWGHLEEFPVDFVQESSDEWQVFKIASFWRSIALLSQEMLINHPELTIALDCRRMFTDVGVVNGLLDWLAIKYLPYKSTFYGKKANASKSFALLSTNQLNLLSSSEIRDFCLDGLSNDFISSCGF